MSKILPQLGRSVLDWASRRLSSPLNILASSRVFYIFIASSSTPFVISRFLYVFRHLFLHLQYFSSFLTSTFFVFTYFFFVYYVFLHFLFHLQWLSSFPTSTSSSFLTAMSFFISYFFNIFYYNKFSSLKITFRPPRQHSHFFFL